MTLFRLPAITTSQMQELERLVAQDFHLTPLQLQENVGLALARLASHLLADDLQNRPIVIVAGASSNGAMALVAARRLLNWGAAVQIIGTHPPEELRDSAMKRQWHILQSMGAPMAWAEEGWEIPPADLLIEALGSYRSKRPAQGITRTLIQLINSSAAPIVSLDLPGGVAGEGGTCFTPHVRSTATLVVHLPKVGQLLEPARSACGQLYLAETGVPAALYERFGWSSSPLRGNLPFAPLWIEGDEVFVRA